MPPSQPQMIDFYYDVNDLRSETLLASGRTDGRELPFRFFRVGRAGLGGLGISIEELVRRDLERRRGEPSVEVLVGGRSR
jgi:hypothetical protein